MIYFFRAFLETAHVCQRYRQIYCCACRLFISFGHLVNEVEVVWRSRLMEIKFLSQLSRERKPLGDCVKTFSPCPLSYGLLYYMVLLFLFVFGLFVFWWDRKPLPRNGRKVPVPDTPLRRIIIVDTYHRSHGGRTFVII